MATLEKLPSVIVDALFAFLFTDSELQFQNGSALSAAAESFILVNHEWLNVFDKYIAPRVLRSATVTWGFKTRKCVLEMRRQLTLRGVYVENLVIHRVPPLGVGRSQWATALSYTPHVHELDLSKLNVSGMNQLIGLLWGAADKCKQVRVLKLPSGRMLDATHAAFSHALEAWHGAGGLTRLSLSPSNVGSSHQHAEAYVKALAQFCPKLQRLDGWVHTTWDPYNVSDQWMVSVATWKQFCGACKDLEAFEWYRVPFATSFFEIFGQSPKPMLRRLHYQAGHWNWRTFMNETGTETTIALKTLGYGQSAKSPQSALRGCPQLEELAVSWERLNTSHYRDQVMNPEVFGDEFIQETVVRCPRLRRFLMREVNKPTWPTSTTWPITTLTDSAIRALAGLRDLREVEISTFDLSAEALFELVVGSEPRQSTLPVSVYHEYRIQIAKHQQPELVLFDSVFVKAVVGFLELLAAREVPFSDEDDCISLWLVQTTSPFANGEQVKSDLQRLAASVRAKHPRVELTLRLVYRDGEFSGEIESFGFQLHRLHSTTAVNRPPEWKIRPKSSANEWVETRLDDVFVKRERVNGLYGDDDDDDDGGGGRDDYYDSGNDDESDDEYDYY